MTTRITDLSELEAVPTDVTEYVNSLGRHGRPKYRRWTEQEMLRHLADIRAIQLQLAVQIDLVHDSYPMASKLRGLLKTLEGFLRFYNGIEREAGRLGYNSVARQFTAPASRLWIYDRYCDEQTAVDICNSWFR